MLTTITSTVIYDWDRTGPVELWLWAQSPFMADDGGNGVMVQSASPLTDGLKAINVRRIACTVDTGTNTLTIPAVTNIYSTLDALDDPFAHYSAYFFTPNGTRIKAYESFEDFALPALASQSWEDIRTYNNASASALFRDTIVFNRTESDRRYLLASGGAIVPSTRAIATASPLTGGGALSGDLSLGISTFIGDSGTGGVRGVVPAPAAGDAAANKFLNANGGWAVAGGAPAGAGAELQFRSSGSAFGALTGSSVSGAVLSLGGVLKGYNGGQAFESLANALESITGYNSTAYQGLAFQRGASGIAAVDGIPALNFQIHQRPNASPASNTLFNYSFNAARHGSAAANDGNVTAVYNLVGRITTDATLTHDVVGVAGIAGTLAGPGHAFGFLADASTNSVTGVAVGLETDVRNNSGADAVDPTFSGVLTTNPLTFGQSVVGVGNKNSAGFLITSASGAPAAFYAGVYFSPGAIDTTTGRGIDMRYVVGGTSIPILLGNTAIIKSLDSAAAFKGVIGMNGSDQITIGSDTNTAIFGRDIRFATVTSPFVAGAGQIYQTADQGLVIAAGTGGTYDFLLASRSGATLATVISNSSNLQLGGTAGLVYLGSGALATNAVTGMPAISSTAGTPTDTTASPTAGYFKMVWDSTAHKLWVLDGTWRFIQFS